MNVITFTGMKNDTSRDPPDEWDPFAVTDTISGLTTKSDDSSTFVKVLDKDNVEAKAGNKGESIPDKKAPDDRDESSELKRADSSSGDDLFKDIDAMAGNEGESILDKLSWRQNPADNFSDWTIVIQQVNGGPSTTYHVHKSVLGAGQNKSDYFAKAFHNALPHSSNSRSEISLEGPAAEAFPALLDYMYDPTTNHGSRRAHDKFTMDNAVSLRYLAQYFAIRNLFLDVTRFLQDALRNKPPKNALDILTQAARFHDEALVQKAADACAEHLEVLEVADLVSLDLDLFVKIALSHKRVTESKALSKIVAQVCESHEDELKWPTFKELTSKDEIPCIDPGASIALLKLCMRFQSDAETSSQSEAWADLRKRCTDTCTRSWEVTLSYPLRSSHTDEAKNGKELPHQGLPPPTQLLVLETALCQAGTEAKKLRTTLTKCQNTHSAQMAAMKREFESKLKSMKQNHSTAMTSVKTLLQASHSSSVANLKTRHAVEVANLKKEIENMKKRGIYEYGRNNYSF